MSIGGTRLIYLEHTCANDDTQLSRALSTQGDSKKASLRRQRKQERGRGKFATDVRPQTATLSDTVTCVSENSQIMGPVYTFPLRLDRFACERRRAQSEIVDIEKASHAEPVKFWICRITMTKPNHEYASTARSSFHLPGFISSFLFFFC